MEVLRETSPNKDLYFILNFDLVLLADWAAATVAAAILARSFWEIGTKEWVR